MWCRSMVAGSSTSAAGTPAYISPESISGARATEASDWYSVGITLYEALTGRVPFEGPFDEQLRHKRNADPPAPSRMAADVPDELSAICIDLISGSVDRRLRGRDALRALTQGDSSRDTASRKTVEATGEPSFVGREQPLGVLRRAFMAAHEGRAASVYLHGPSGIGKSALVRRFLDQLSASGDVVILRGRCYEQETVPYKALDEVIDGLSGYLASLPRPEAETLLPARRPRVVAAVPRHLAGRGHRGQRAAGARDRRPVRPAAPGVRRAARTADRHRLSSSAGLLDRRSALGRCGQHRAARRTAAASCAATAADAALLSQRGDGVEAVSSGAARPKRIRRLRDACRSGRWRTRKPRRSSDR